MGEVARIQSLLDTGRAREAAEAATKALASDPEDPTLHALLAEAFCVVDPGAAVEPAKRAVALEPNDPVILRTLVRARWRAGKLTDALDTVTALRTMAPEMPEAYSWRAGILLDQIAHSRRRSRNQHRLDDAEKSAERAVELAPWWAGSHLMLGRVMLAAGDTRLARIHTTQALAIDPDYAPGHELLGDIAHRDGDRRAAGDHYMRAGKADPTASMTDSASRLRMLQYPAAVGFIVWLVVRIGLTGARWSGAWLIFLIAIVVGLAGLAIALWIHRTRVRSSLSSDARRALETDDALGRAGRRWRPWRRA